MKRHRATRFLSLLLALAMLLSLSALPVLADEDEGTGDSGTVEAEVAEAEAQVTEAEADANLAEEEETGTEADESGEAQESDESDETQETGEAQETQESDDSQAADDTDPAADESTGTDDSQTQGTEEDTGDDSGDEDEEIVLTLTSTDEGIAVAAEEDEDGDGDSGSETTVAMIGDVGYTTLADAVEAVTDSTETIITLTANTTVTADITISGTQKIVLDLAGYTVTMGSYVVSVSGFLTIQDSNSSVSVSDTYEVTYSGGSLTATGVAVQVVSGGIVTLASGKVAGKYGLRAWGDEEGTGSAVNSTVKVAGGYVYAQECAVTVQCNGATAEISGGVLETADNAVVAGNGTNGQGGTTITISGGTLIGHIQTSGYVACGIYHPQSGTLNISGGTIYVDGGCGILMRGGTLSMTGGTIITTAASATGMVGDSRVVVDASGVIYDLDSGYYDVSNVEIDLSDNVTINAASGSNAVTVVAENSTYTSGTITVSGGTYSSDVSEYIDTSSCSISLSSDGTGYTVVSGITDVVAKIGEVGYTSLAAAVAAASDGDTITLADDVDISTTGLTISSGKSITLDLNGHTIKAANTNPGCIAVYGGLTLKDNSDTSCNGEGNGKIYTETAYNGSSTGYALIDVVGTFTMESGYIYAVIDNASSYGQFGVGSAAGGDITINGGKIEAGWYAVSGNGNDTTTSSTITINGGYLISTADYAIYHPQSGTLIVNGGTIYGEAGGICMNRGTLTVTGGTITSKGTGNTGTWGDGTGNLSAAALNVSAEYGDVTTTISGGTFTAETNALILTDSTSHTATVSITGGTFSSDVSDYAAEGYAATANSDGTYTVAVDYEAKIGDTTYKTLEAAIAAAKESGESEVTITLLADVETDATIEWSQATPVLTIDLNGHNITKTADSTSGNTFDVFQGTFTLTGSGTVSNENGSSALRIKGSTDSTAENYTVVTIGTDVTLLAKYAMFIAPYESSKNPHAYGVVVNIYGTLTATEGYGFYVNGQMVDTSGNVPVVNVYNGAKITASSESSQNDDSPIGIYIAGYAEITIKDGATISGDTGIEIRAGVLTVNGGTITGNATTFSTAENGNGATTVGAGIAVVQHTTGLPMSVTINGGTISGLYGVYEANTQENDTETYTSNVSVSIAGGTITTTDTSTYTAVYGTEDITVISNGTFNTDVKELAADGFTTSEEDEDGYYTIVADNVAKIVVDESTTKYYTSLADAFSEATNGQTITLLTNVTLSEGITLSEDKSVTLDLQGYNITRTSDNTTAALITVSSGTLTVQDTSSEVDGYIDGATYTVGSSTYVGYGIGITGGTVNIKSGTVKGYRGIYGTSGSLTVSGGTVSGTQMGILADGTLGVTISDSAVITNSSGSITKWAFYTNTTYTGTTKITGGTIGGDYSKYAVSVWGGTVEITGGTLTGINTAVTAYNEGTTVTIGDSDNPSSTSPTLTGSTYYGIEMGKGAKVTVDAGAIQGVSCGVFVGYGNDADNPTTLVVNGGEISADEIEGVGICTNGSQNYTSITINGGTVSAAYGMYLPAMNSTTTITGGTITGTTTGIEIRAGSLTISGDTTVIESTCQEFDTQTNGSGTTVIGAGIAISQHSTNQDVTVTITGGTISGYYGVYELNTYADKNSEAVTLTIPNESTATISSTDKNDEDEVTGQAVYSASVSEGTYGNTTFSISGGSYSSEVPVAYCAEGYAPTTEADEDGMYTVGDSVADGYDSNGDKVGAYTTFAAAMEATDEAVKIILYAENVTADTSTTVIKNLTIDLNGKNLTINEDATLTVDSGAEVTIIDSKSAGLVTNNGTINVTNGTLDIRSLGYTTDSTSGNGLLGSQNGKISLGSSGVFIVPDAWATEWAASLGEWTPNWTTATGNNGIFSSAAQGAIVYSYGVGWKCTTSFASSGYTTGTTYWEESGTYLVEYYKGWENTTSTPWTYPTKDESENLVFAGWYQEEACTNTYTETSGVAYARFVKLSYDYTADNGDDTTTGVINFLGGSLRMNDYSGYDYTSLRFGYDIVLPTGCSVKDGESESQYSWYWKWTIQNATNELTVYGSAYTDAQKSGYSNYSKTFCSNLVIKGIPADYYNTTMYSTLTVVYVTADGTTVSATESQRSRSVYDVASSISQDNEASENQKDYASGIISASSSSK